MLSPEVMQTISLQQDNAIFHHQESLRELLDFHALNYVLTCIHVLFLQYYEVYKILRAIILVFFSNSFQSFLFDGKSICLRLYWSIKGLIFVVLCGSFLIFFMNLCHSYSILKAFVIITFRIYCCFLIF